MKLLATYWVIGCVLYGVSWGSYTTRCPRDDIYNPAEMFAFVATWPTVVGALFTWRGQLTECKK